MLYITKYYLIKTHKTVIVADENNKLESAQNSLGDFFETQI